MAGAAVDPVILRTMSSVGGALRKSVASGELTTAVIILVSGSNVRWEIFEQKTEAGAAGRESRLSTNAARLAVVEAASAISQKAKTAVIESIS